MTGEKMTGEKMTGKVRTRRGSSAEPLYAGRKFS
jgi:hypothetical protein